MIMIMDRNRKQGKSKREMSFSNGAGKIKSYSRDWVIIAVIVSTIWLINCIARGLAPFGSHMINVGDMGEQFEPMYLFLWDVLHGNKNLFFDWETSLGSNMAGAVWHFGLISPFNLVYLLIPRQLVVVSMPYLIMVKLIFIGFSMDYVMQKWFGGLSRSLRIAFVLMYVFSTYNMENYRASLWLDVVFMFPLVIYSFFELLLRGKKWGYLFTLTLTVVMNFQHTYMLALMLLLLLGVLLLQSEETRRRILLLIFTTAEVMLLTAVVWVPGILQIFSSKRAGRNMSITDIWEQIWLAYPDRWLKLVGLGVSLGIFGVYVLKEKRWKKEKEVIFLLITLGMLLMPFIFESVHIFWHGGSYQGYPIRFGYMVAFWILIAGAYAISKMEQAILPVTRRLYLPACVILLVGETMLCAVKGLKMSFPEVLICIFLEIVIGVGICNMQRRFQANVLILFALVHTLAMSGNLWIYSTDYEDNFSVLGSNEIYEKKDELFENVTPLKRVASRSIVTNNYPLVIGKGGNSMSAYLAVTDQERQDMLVDLGYALVGDRLCDYGGTVFSDMLLGVHHVFGTKEVNEALYSKGDKVGGLRFYNSRYCLDVGMLLEELSELKLQKEMPFDNQNRIAEKWFGKVLFSIQKNDSSVVTIETKPDSILYIYSPQMKSVDELIIRNEATGEVQKYEIAASGWNNGIQELGIWHGEKVTIEASEDEVEQLQAAVLDLRDIEALNPTYAEVSEIKYSNTQMMMTMTADEQSYLYLPIYNSEGWHCKVNGKTQEICSVINMMALPVEKGKNQINLYYVSPGFYVGVGISILGVLMLISNSLIEGRWHIPEKNNKIINAGILIIWGLAVAVIYVGSVVGAIVFVMKMGRM